MSDPFSRAWDAAGDQWNAWFRSGGGGGGSQEFGGLSAEDREFKKMLYDQFRELPDEYEAYTGDRFADRSPEELALLQEMQEGAMYDKASQDLGFASDIYKKGAQYGVDELQSDAEKFMTSDLYRNEVRDQILRDMNRGASMSGMDLNASAWGSGAGGTHSRGGTSGTQRLLQNQNYMSQAGDALTKLNFGAYQDALNRAGQLRQARETSAGRYGQTALQNLGIGQQGVASRYGAFRDERGDRQRDLDLAYKNWLDEKNFDIKKLGLGSQLFANMPMEEKVVTQQPASGGK